MKRRHLIGAMLLTLIMGVPAHAGDTKDPGKDKFFDGLFNGLFDFSPNPNPRGRYYRRSLKALDPYRRRGEARAESRYGEDDPAMRRNLGSKRYH